jgi:hypothetical protein
VREQVEAAGRPQAAAAHWDAVVTPQPRVEEAGLPKVRHLTHDQLQLLAHPRELKVFVPLE